MPLPKYLARKFSEAKSPALLGFVAQFPDVILTVTIRGDVTSWGGVLDVDMRLLKF